MKPNPTTALLGTGQVQHTRLRPARHGFRYSTYFLMLPMRALAREPGGWGAVRHNRLGLVSFHDRDHGTGQGPALAWFESVLASEGLLEQADGEVWLHTYPRVAGYAFKPVSFWYAHRRDGALLAVLAEVNNTFGERHCYLLSGPDLAWGRELTANKVFHVSPFCAVSGDYRFRFLRTADRTVVRIEHHNAQGPLLLTSVSGHLQAATAPRVRRAFFGMPMMSLGVVFRIHWQALQLAVKRVPFFRKPQPPQAFVTR
ncbi:MAG: DUF1365 domain-containing protein [Betaproteobacteria bacterium]